MTYFRTDDKFWSHPKVIGVSLAARGLWVTAGSWAACYLSDGYVPHAALAMVGTPTQVKKAAHELVTAELWIDVGDGYQFREWEHHNYTKEEVDQQRERRRTRQKTWRTKKEMRDLLQNINKMPQ